MDNVNIALEVFGMLVSLLLLLSCAVVREKQDKLTRLFAAMLTINILVLFSDVMTWLLSGNAHNQTLLYAFNFFVYSLGYVIVALFTRYLEVFISRRTSLRIRASGVICALCVVAVALVGVSIFNHMYFSFEDGVYVRGPFYWLSQVYPIAILAADMVIVLHYSKWLEINDTLALLSYSILPVAAMIIQMQIYGLTLLYLATTLSLLIIYLILQTNQTKRLHRQELELSDFRVDIMLSQIQPHFLYNALNTIEYLCLTEPKKAADALENFSKYLRGNMDSLTRKEPIPFSKELAHLENYLTIERLRFPKVNISYDLKTTEFFLPALTLQPLVENAVRYGVTPKEAGGTVCISTWEDDESIYLRVQDDGVGFDPMAVQSDGRSHIGISNTRSRVASMCGGRLEIESILNSGTKMTAIIPRGVKK